MTQKIYHINKIFLSSAKIFLIKVTSQYLFNVFILFITVSYIEINLKINPKMCTFKNLEEIWKTWKIFLKASGNPDYNIIYIFSLNKYLYAQMPITP